MRKAVILAAVAALSLAGCGKEIARQTDLAVIAPDGLTTADETTAEEDITAPEDEPAVTAVKEEEAPPAETTTKKKEIDPELIDVACMDKVEVYQQVKLRDFMFDSNAELKNGDELLDTEDIGEHEVTLKLEYDGGVAEKTVTYYVADTTPPIMLLGDSIYVSTGTWFDPDDYISYVDNYDRAPTLDWDGEVDTSVEGSYYIKLYITDDSGNQLAKGVSVTVSDAVSDPYYDDSEYYFSDFVKRYDEPDREFGIDVSRWQGDIDFEAVAAEGCSFAIIRMGYGEYGGADLDEYYYNNIEGAANAGLDVGVYFYSTDTTQEGARETARRIAEVLDGRQLDFPVAFDWEDFQGFQYYGLNIHDLCEVYEAFAEEMENNGYEAMLYSSRNFLDYFWENRGGRPIWVADYAEETKYTGDWYIWQRCGTGRISGINGAVDLDVLQRE